MIKRWSLITCIAVLICMFASGISFAGTSGGFAADAKGPGRTTSEEYKGRPWVSQKPFQPYPTEEQLFSEPGGAVEIGGIKADSYAKGQEVSWKTDNWEFYAAGHSEQDGIRIAREVLAALKDRTDLIPGAVRGKLRVLQFGNPMFVTIGWTYDDRIWYELSDGKGSPELMVKMLEAAAKDRSRAILLDGAPLENIAELRDGGLFLPLRTVCEALGFEVLWAEKDSTATVVRGDRKMVINTAAGSMEAGGGKVSLEGKYAVIDGRIYLEESIFAGHFGMQVKRDEAGRMVTLLPEPVPLGLEPVGNNQVVRVEEKAQIGNAMGGDLAYVEGITAYIYKKADDVEDLHAGYAGKNGYYDLGAAGSIINSDDSLTSVRALQLYGKTLIKFQGVFGSHVLRTSYFTLEEDVPKPFLSVDGQTTEMDVDGDGKKEIVAELSGTIPSVSIFEWDGKSLLGGSVEEALGADSVEFNHEDGSFRAYYKANAQKIPDGIAYQYTGDGLELKKADRDTGDVLSENVIDYNGDSGYEKVVVRMTEGKQYEDEAPGPFMGWNWQGKFAVQLLNAEGNVLSEMGLNKIFNPDGADMVFNRTFRLQFDDYNNDGYPDFTIGQYGSSNGNLYRLFTVKNGKIEVLPVKNGGSGELFSSGGRSRYTREFDKFAKSGFINWYYNNALGKNIRQNFAWDGAQFVMKPGGGGEDDPFGMEKDKAAPGAQAIPVEDPEVLAPMKAAITASINDTIERDILVCKKIDNYYFALIRLQHYDPKLKEFDGACGNVVYVFEDLGEKGVKMLASTSNEMAYSPGFGAAVAEYGNYAIMYGNLNKSAWVPENDTRRDTNYVRMVVAYNDGATSEENVEGQTGYILISTLPRKIEGFTLYDQKGETTKDDRCDMQYINDLNAQTQFRSRN